MAMESVPYVDELIREYLVFRGFTTTLKAFETDTKLDKDKGFQTKNIAQQLFTLAQNLDIQGLLQYWRYLDLRFFSRLEEKYLDTAKRLEQCLVKFCMATAVRQKQPDRLMECFDEYAGAMVDHTEWARWFTLPYIAAPDKDPFFQIYFTPQWQDVFRLSLYNFIDTVFRHMPLPGLLNFHADYAKRQMLQSEIQQLKSQLRKLRGDLETSTMHNQAIQQKLDTVTTAQKNAAPHDKASEHSSSSVANAMPAEPSLSSQLSSTDRNKATLSEQDKSDQQSVRSLASNQTIEDIPYIISSQEVFQEHTCEVMMAKFSVDGNVIASFDTDNIIKVWSHSQQAAKANSKVTVEEPVTVLEWDQKSSKLLFVGTDAGVIRVYNAESRAFVHTFECPVNYPSPSATLLVGICGPKSDDQLTPTCDNTAFPATDLPQSCTLVVWDWKTMTQQITSQLAVDGDNICSVQFNHNGQLLVIAEITGCIQILDVNTLELIAQWSVDHTELCFAAFSFDENEIYCVNQRGQVSCWSLQKPGTSISPFGSAPQVEGADDHFLSPHLITTSHDTEHIAACLVPFQASIMVTKTGRVLQNLRRHSQPITCIDWAPDQNILLTASEDGLIRVHQLVKVMS